MLETRNKPFTNTLPFFKKTNLNEIEKPIKRGRLRQVLGKEYFILKRKLNWIFTDKKYSKRNTNNNFNHSVFKHKSLILRPLKDVEMYLQENKRTNLEIAIKHLIPNQLELHGLKKAQLKFTKSVLEKLIMLANVFRNIPLANHSFRKGD